ncbi:hypothetical protein E2I00_014376, partial [Balaenoptera physalus]
DSRPISSTGVPNMVLTGITANWKTVVVTQGEELLFRGLGTRAEIRNKSLALPFLPHVTMAVSLGPLSDPRLAKNKQNFQDFPEKFLVSQATAYSLANQLQRYKCEAFKDITESVLGEKLLFEALRLAEKLAEKPTQAESCICPHSLGMFSQKSLIVCHLCILKLYLLSHLGTCDILTRSQARELTQLWRTLWEQHLKDFLIHNDLDNHKGQGFQERLMEGHRLAEHLAHKLSPEIHEDEEDEQAQETLTPSVELQEVEKKEVPQESQDECVLTPSILQGSSDCNQPYSDGKFAFDESEVGPAPDGACGCSHAKEDEIPTDLPGYLAQPSFSFAAFFLHASQTRHLRPQAEAAAPSRVGSSEPVVVVPSWPF